MFWCNFSSIYAYSTVFPFCSSKDLTIWGLSLFKDKKISQHMKFWYMHLLYTYINIPWYYLFFYTKILYHPTSVFWFRITILHILPNFALLLQRYCIKLPSSGVPPVRTILNERKVTAVREFGTNIWVKPKWWIWREFSNPCLMVSSPFLSIVPSGYDWYW